MGGTFEIDGQNRQINFTLPNAILHHNPVEVPDMDLAVFASTDRKQTDGGVRFHSDFLRMETQRAGDQNFKFEFELMIHG